MADVMEADAVDKKAQKAAEKARKKEAKKQAKAAAEQGDGLDAEDEGIGGKIVIFFVTIFILVIWMAIIALLIKWDVGEFGSTVLGPLLKDVPYVNRILPDSYMEEFSTEESPYAYESMEEAVEQIKQLEIALSEAQNTSTDNAAYITELERLAQELQQYKQNEAAFEEEKQKFYEEIVFGDSAPDIEQYKEFYESIAPANAEVLYRQVVAQTAADEKIEDYVNTYKNMKPKEAAAVFDAMTDNLKLVASILEQMDAKSRGDILGKMNTETAAKVTEIMKP